MSLLEIKNLSVGYGAKPVVKDVSIEIKQGQMVGILGPNGCGKSTLLKAICNGLPSKGTLLMDEKEISKLSEKELARICSYVPQQSGLAIDIPVLEVIMMGFYPFLGMLERPDKKMRNKALEMIEMVCLSEKQNTSYMELSEGQKRLCILARSLVSDTKLMLMDEPDAALDFNMRNQILRIVHQRVMRRGDSVLLTLHDMNLALNYCDVIYLMKDGVLVDAFAPKVDAIDEIEDKLSKLYGTVHLMEYVTNCGEKKRVMVMA